MQFIVVGVVVFDDGFGVAHSEYAVCQLGQIATRREHEVLQLVGAVAIAIVAYKHHVCCFGQALWREDRGVGRFVQHVHPFEAQRFVALRNGWAIRQNSVIILESKRGSMRFVQHDAIVCVVEVRGHTHLLCDFSHQVDNARVVPFVDQDHIRVCQPGVDPVGKTIQRVAFEAQVRKVVRERFNRMRVDRQQVAQRPVVGLFVADGLMPALLERAHESAQEVGVAVIPV